MPNYMRRIFWFVNKFFMVPIFRLGLGPLFVNPFTGYIMVLKLVGRKSGKTRFAPVNYAIQDGKVYLVSGFRGASDWYRNVRSNPDVEAILPGGSIAGTITEVSDPAVRGKVIRQIFKNAGFAGFFEGFNPFRISDDELARRTVDIPLLSLQPSGVGNGSSDPGGWAWVWMPVALVILTWALVTIFR